MERKDGARTVQRRRHWMKSLFCSICNVMAVRSRKVPRWKTMDRDIWEIFSRSSTSIMRLYLVVPCFSTKIPMEKPSTLPIFNIKEGMYHPKKILTEITKLSSTAPTSFPFNFYSCLEDEDLIIAAERMPNIKKTCLGTKGQFKESTLNSLEKTVAIPTFIACLQNLATLNLSHCIFREQYYRSNLRGFIRLSCVRKSVAAYVKIRVTSQKQWRNDEIKELEF
ncbi:hypothetical protein HID58_011902 [Brassica napus]|uniref:FBD domain-containing protein n=1 Tax=Brassica napus TaxID=3708 RepID=A0ABQ8DZI2_BRANA|nr:hypothetical protein HID58_011902 [Brassica napus]